MSTPKMTRTSDAGFVTESTAMSVGDAGNRIVFLAYPGTHGEDFAHGSNIYIDPQKDALEAAPYLAEGFKPNEKGGLLFLGRFASREIIPGLARIEIRSTTKEITLTFDWRRTPEDEWETSIQTVSWTSVPSEIVSSRSRDEYLAGVIKEMTRDAIAGITQPYMAGIARFQETVETTRQIATFCGTHLTFDFDDGLGIKGWKFGTINSAPTWLCDRPPVENELCWMFESTFGRGGMKLHLVRAVRYANYDSERDGRQTWGLEDLGYPVWSTTGQLCIPEKASKMDRLEGGMVVIPRAAMPDIAMRELIKSRNAHAKTRTRLADIKALVANLVTDAVKESIGKAVEGSNVPQIIRDSITKVASSVSSKVTTDATKAATEEALGTVRRMQTAVREAQDEMTASKTALKDATEATVGTLERMRERIQRIIPVDRIKDLFDEEGS